MRRRTRKALTVLVLLLAAGVVLTGPGIRDNAVRALWILLGLAALLSLHFLLARRNGIGVEAGE